VTLHIEDEFFLAELGGGELRFERSLLRDFEKSAVAADASMRGIEGEQRRRCAARGNEEAATALVQPASEALCPFRCERVRMTQRCIQRNRREFAVGGRVELDRQPLAFRIHIDARRYLCRHRRTPRFAVVL
jgi:hypothetical protein